MNRDRLVEQLKVDESCRLRAYQDIEGFWTVGWGHLLGGGAKWRGTVWTQEQADQALQDDIDKMLLLISQYEWYRRLDDVRQTSIANATYNLGAGGINGFHHAIAALIQEDWQTAHDELLNSKWARQVGARATRIADMVLTGAWPKVA